MQQVIYKIEIVVEGNITKEDVSKIAELGNELTKEDLSFEVKLYSYEEK